MRHLGQERHVPPDTSERASLEHFQLNPDRVSRGEAAGAGGLHRCSPGYNLKVDPDFTENALARTTARLTPACPNRQTLKSLAGSPHTSRVKTSPSGARDPGTHDPGARWSNRARDLCALRLT